MELSGLVAAVTGGGTGIGRGIAIALADAGCTVAIGGRREAPLKKVADEYSGPGTIVYRVLDVAERPTVREFFRWLAEHHDAPAILVNSAGINVKNRGLEDTTPEDWEKVIRVNLNGAFWCIQSVVPGMKKRGDGLIINLSSVAGKRALPVAGVAYSASKFGMTSLGTSAGLALADSGVRVTNVYPGEVNTPILDQRPSPVPQEKKDRMVHPEDIGALVTTIAKLPSRSHIPEVIIKPLYQDYL